MYPRNLLVYLQKCEAEHLSYDDPEVLKQLSLIEYDKGYIWKSLKKSFWRSRRAISNSSVAKTSLKFYRRNSKVMHKVKTAGKSNKQRIYAFTYCMEPLTYSMVETCDQILSRYVSPPPIWDIFSSSFRFRQFSHWTI